MCASKILTPPSRCENPLRDALTGSGILGTARTKETGGSVHGLHISVLSEGSFTVQPWNYACLWCVFTRDLKNVSKINWDKWRASSSTERRHLVFSGFHICDAFSIFYRRRQTFLRTSKHGQDRLCDTQLGVRLNVDADAKILLWTSKFWRRRHQCETPPPYVRLLFFCPEDVFQLTTVEIPPQIASLTSGFNKRRIVSRNTTQHSHVLRFRDSLCKGSDGNQSRLFAMSFFK